jgi:hypothetical protein
MRGTSHRMRSSPRLRPASPGALTPRAQANAWAGLVSVIERGYDDDIYEYTNDLCCRNWLHEAWLLLDDHVIQLWTPRIKALVPSLALVSAEVTRRI